ncbi:MAG: hypothetical protein AAF772_07455 [Acidobacteriota bacterium]
MQTSELSEYVRHREESRMARMRKTVPVARAIGEKRYHTPEFQTVFLLGCEKALRRPDACAHAWAHAAVPMVEAWKHRRPASLAWARFLVRAHLVRASSQRVSGDMDAAETNYLRALYLCGAYAHAVPPSDVCDLYHRCGVFWTCVWKYDLAELTLKHAMDVAERVHHPDEAPDPQDIARSHYYLGQFYAQFGMPAGEAVQTSTAAEQAENRTHAAHHLGRAACQLDVNVNRYLACGALINLVTVSTYNSDPEERRAILTEIEEARIKIRQRTEAVSQFAGRLDWLQGLILHSLGEHAAAADLLRETRLRFARQHADLLFLIITLDLAEVERARGQWEAIQKLALGIGKALERRAGKDGPAVDHVRAWRDAVIASRASDPSSWPVLDEMRSCLFNLPGLPSNASSASPQLPAAEPA